MIALTLTNIKVERLVSLHLSVLSSVLALSAVIDPGLVGTCDNIEPTEEINVTRQDVEM